MSKYKKFLSKKNVRIKPTSEQILAWVSRNFEYKELKSGQIRICNPDGDTNYSMQISKDDAVVHDFRVNHTQFDGPFLKFVSMYKNISFREAVEEVCGDEINILNIKKEEKDCNTDISLPSGCRSLRDNIKDNLRDMCLGYLLKERCIDIDTIFRSNIHYLGTTVVVPYYEFGELVYYQSRQILSKVFHFPSFSSAGDHLYNIDNVEPHSDIIIVESIFNALSIGDGCVATGGASLKPNQIKFLRIVKPERIILAPDNDNAGIESIKKDFYSLVKQFDNIYYCIPPEKDIDWNDMKKDKVNVRNYIFNNYKKLTYKNLFEGMV